MTVRVFVQPRAARDAVVGTHGDALKVKVKAPPLDGRANRAVEDLLARVVGVPAKDVFVGAGEMSRHKRVEITGVTPDQVLSAIRHVLSSRAQ